MKQARNSAREGMGGKRVTREVYEAHSDRSGGPKQSSRCRHPKGVSNFTAARNRR